MITVVIPVFNEEKIIGSCLNALVTQKTNQQFELIVVNNNSTDNTMEVMKSFQKKLHLRILFEKEKGRGAARQTGFQEAMGDILLSTDADTIVPDNWIEKLSSTLLEHEAVAVTGTCKIDDGDLFTNGIFNFMHPFFMKSYRLFFKHYWLSGFSFAIYKTVYEKSGGFNRRLNAQEDIELSFRVSNLGNIVFIPDTPVLFSGRRFQRGLLKGLYPYVKTFFLYFILKKEDIYLPDVR